MNMLRTKSIEQTIREGDEPEYQLKRTLSALDLTVFGVGVVIGAGIFTLTGRAAQEVAGPAVVISFVIAATACALAALCYAELSSTVPVSGSAYTFSYATMGELIAWIVGWDLLLELILAAGVVAQGWSAYFNILFGEWGLKLPDNLQGGTGWFTHFDIAAFGLVAVLTCVIATGIKESMRVNLTLVAVKLFIVLFIIVMGIQYINTSNYTPFVTPAQHLESTSDTLKRPLWELMTGMEPQAFGVMGVISGAALVFFAYIGFDVVATTAEETRNPRRDFPRALIGGMATAGVLYVLIAVTAAITVPIKQLAESDAALLEVVKTGILPLSVAVLTIIFAIIAIGFMIITLAEGAVFGQLAKRWAVKR